MTPKFCKNGHTFEKTSDCPVCPECSNEEMKLALGEEFPKIGTPTLRALARTGVSHISALTKYTEKELHELHGFGPRALRLLKDKLNEKGLALANN